MLLQYCSHQADNKPHVTEGLKKAVEFVYGQMCFSGLRLLLFKKSTLSN